jgi:AcrR family transcriptional regulator
MNTDPGATATAVPARQRILATARHRFYADGIRAVSADRLIAEAGVSKVTFYRHFPTKDDLVVAYLREIEDQETKAFDAAERERDDPADVLRWYFERLGDLACAEGFRGCAFLNAAAEFARRDHPARAVVEEHRRRLHDRFVGIVLGMGVAESHAGRVADQLRLLRDGTMIAGSLDADPDRLAAEVNAAAIAVVRAARSGEDDSPDA